MTASLTADASSSARSEIATSDRPRSDTDGMTPGTYRIDGRALPAWLQPERVVDSIARHGNTSAASIPLALDAALADGRLDRGARVLVGAFGAGLTWGGAIIEWGTA